MGVSFGIRQRTMRLRGFGGAPVRAGAKRAQMQGLTNVLKFLVSCSLVGYLAYRYAPSWDRIYKVNLVWCGVALAVFVLQVPMNALRWRIILRHIANSHSDFRKIFLVYYASIFFSQVLPSIAGDLMRVVYHRLIGSSIGKMIITVLLDRGVALAALLLLTLTSLPFIAEFDKAGTTTRTVALITGGGLAGAYSAALLVRTSIGVQLCCNLPPRLQELVKSIAWALISPSAIRQLAPLSLAVHSMLILAIKCAALASATDLTLPVLMAVAPVLLLAHVLPISIGGWGVREAAAVYLFGMAGVDAGSALLVSMLLGLLIMTASLPGALCWLVLREIPPDGSGQTT